ncbi:MULTISPECIES: putative RNA methyltransferase [Marinobacter]|uniref:Methyltransferase domain-containing protein n=1 Tax=Marinobacter xiaoshiensis TaxID=3073652 RepID=A0ABU2HHI7_9GAMM|nr:MULTISPECIES: methyltransferase domain-containing protein [unclassified Marinobacter]MBK1886082.1 methyltransferase domain-containing protein [Marinobacter sp. DY40_1A1]MDS1310538.1 methyltransferase domain-containing protein [Marinobacter sp. F60267]
MTITPFEALACPIDGSVLQLKGRSWQCDAGHSFDIARQGYVHLLPVQNKRSKDPGDNKEMVAARKRFLAAGFYEPIAEAVFQAVFHETHCEAAMACMDAGCGEGYYMRYLAEKMPDAARLAMLGLDISKWAILSAAKQDKTPAWVVGSNANLPVLPETLDCILCLFGFPVYREFARVLRPGGEIVQVDAGPDHLIELRNIIYPELKEPRQPPSDAPEGFTAVDTSAVRFSLTLPDKQSVSDLLAMTPHLYRAGAEGLARVAELESLTVTVEATVKRFKKN